MCLEVTSIFTLIFAIGCKLNSILSCIHPSDLFFHDQTEPPSKISSTWVSQFPLWFGQGGQMVRGRNGIWGMKVSADSINLICIDCTKAFLTNHIYPLRSMKLPKVSKYHRILTLCNPCSIWGLSLKARNKFSPFPSWRAHERKDDFPSFHQYKHTECKTWDHVTKSRIRHLISR